MSMEEILRLSEKQHHIRYSSKRGKTGAFKIDIMKEVPLHYVWEEVCRQYYKTGLKIQTLFMLVFWYLAGIFPLIQM